MTPQIIDTYPLSPMQEGMLFNSLSSPGRGIEIEQIACDLFERVHHDLLRRAWEAVVKRHALLRTSFSWDGKPLQHVHDRVQIPWTVEAVPDGGPEAERQYLEEFLRRDREAGIDLGAPPLMRIALLEMGEGHTCMVLTFHHALLDGRSFPVILDEVFSLYDAYVEGGSVQLPAVIPFKDFIRWVGSRDNSASREFWRNTLAGFSTPTPVPCEGGRRNEAAGRAPHRERHTSLTPECSASLLAFAYAHGVTLNTLIQGCVAILLSRYSGEEDILFGALRACRHATIPGAESMAGVFINLLPVRVSVRGGSRLLSLLKELRIAQTQARLHEHLSLAEVQALSPVPHGTPLFNTILTFDNSSLNATLRAKGGRWLRRTFTIRSQTGYPLTLAVYGGDVIVLGAEYDTGRFDTAAIDRFISHAVTLLEAMPRDPDSRIGDLPWFSEQERTGILSWSAPKGAPVPEKTLHALFEEQVLRTPHGIALEGEGGGVTYEELNRRANRIARRLAALGVHAGVPVGLCAVKTTAMIAGMLGILKAGAAYIPLDPSYPPDYREFVVEDARIAFVVTTPGIAAKFPPRVVRVEIDETAAGEEPGGSPGAAGNGRSLAYIMYTSGTTGRPKGVMVEHRSVVNYVMTIGSQWRISPGDVVLQFASISFDTSAEEIFGALLNGATLVLRTPGMIDTFSGFLSACGERGVTVLDLPTAFWHELVAAMAEERLSLPPSVRLVVIGGEQASADRVGQWWQRVEPCVRLINGYGPTETTIVATLFEIPPRVSGGGALPVIPIGRPVANAAAYVLDGERNLLPVGVSGELCIGGEGVARGYLDRSGRDMERFIPDPFDVTGTGRLYCTGDLARWLADGELEFLGRIDEQVKIRGFRIETAEVETVLRQHPGVRDAAVIAREDTPGEKNLVAYCIVREPAGSDPAELRGFLRHRLPEHMIPSAFVVLDAFPATPGGKVDRRAFPAPARGSDRIPDVLDLPASPVQKALAAMFGETLGRFPVGVEDNFFELGGHSLLAMQLISRVRRAWEISVSFQELFEAPTVRGLSALVERRMKEEIEKMSEEEVARLRQ